mgnify:CR=1 FL=1
MRIEKTALDAQNRCVYSLYKEKGCIGHAVTCADCFEALEIAPEWQSRGYGSYLLREVLRQNGGFDRTAPSEFTAPLPDAGNTAAQALAAKFGFVPRGELLVRRRVPDLSAVQLCHEFLEAHLTPGGLFLDATCGNGNDTLFLCRLAGQNGRVLGMDIQPQAVDRTNRRLKEAGIGTYILFQETYNKENYQKLHPYGPKSNYAYHTEAMDRAMEGGIDDVGIGVLFGLTNYLYDFIGLIMHAEHLEAAHGVGPHTISVPRICPADDIDVADFENALPDEIFHKIVAVIRISVPYTGMIISTRETQSSREKVLELGVSQISGGSNTAVGGYDEADRSEEDTAQFDVSDHRTLDQVIAWLIDLGYVPSFCTACYRLGRTGDRFMSLVKTGQIANCCAPNALMTLKEYLVDYASPQTRLKGEAMIAREMAKVPNEKVRTKATENLAAIERGERDFRF